MSEENIIPEELIESEVVNLGFVLNVIENPEERIEVLNKSWSLAKRILAVSVLVGREIPEVMYFHLYESLLLSTPEDTI